MSEQTTYVNPFTDFGFKRLFGEEAHKGLLLDFLNELCFDKKEHELTNRFEKWVYFLKNLENFDEIPEILNEPIFKEAFDVAKIANFNKKQLNTYNESLKNFRDLHSVVQSAVDKAVNKQVKETIIRILKRGKASVAEIAEDNDVSVELVLAIQTELAKG